MSLLTCDEQFVNENTWTIESTTSSSMCSYLCVYIDMAFHADMSLYTDDTAKTQTTMREAMKMV